MRYAKQVASLLVVAGSLLLLAACGQKANCSGITFGGTGSGSAGGGINGSGSVCGTGSSNNNGGGGSSTDLLYYLGGGTVIDAASVSSTTFANLTGYTPIAFPNGAQLGENFTIVNKKFLYVPLVLPPGGGAVLGYAISRGTGALTQIGSNSFPTGSANANIAISDPQGRFLFVSDTDGGTISVFKIDSTTGALTASGSPVSTGGGPHAMIVDGTGTYLYFATGIFVFGFSIDQTAGTLTPLFSSPFNLPMVALQPDSTGQFLVGVTGFDTSVSVIPIGAGTGILGIPTTFPSVSAPGSLAMSPNGKFLFTFAVDGLNRPLPIEGFTFDETTGTLTEMASSPFVNLPKVNTGLFDPNGTSLLGVTVTSFFIYSIDATTGAPTSPLPSLGVAHDERYAITN